MANGAVTTTLNGAINASTTTIVLTNAAQFPSTGTNFVLIGTEMIQYTGVSSNTLTGVTRGARGTTAASHSDGVTVTNATDYAAWNEQTEEGLALDPGMWSLDNFGDKAICLIHDSACFSWDSSLGNATETRASIITGAPTASRHMVVSTLDRDWETNCFVTKII